MNTSFSLRLAASFALALFAVPRTLHAVELAVAPIEAGARVTGDGRPFAEYVAKSGHQPVIWPVIGPDGRAMTRQYPLGPKLAGEPDDHLHHRSLWFNHGDVNGCDFWMEPDADGVAEANNQIEHRKFVALEAEGATAKIVTSNDWTSGGVKVCEDVRTIEFGADERVRWIDFAIELRASEGPVVFGDTKEGSFGVRVPGTMSVDAKQGGEITNSRGERDAAAWGRPAEWVDYRGPVDGRPAGIAIFNLPDSFRHPCRWHVRTYGLFAANPFGQHDFPPEGSQQGAHTLGEGDTLRLHYRVLLHNGELPRAEIEAAYQRVAD